MKRKRPLTLIEFIVSMGLLSLLVATVSFWYSHLTRQKSELAAAKWPLVEERFAETQLQRILPKATRPATFFTEEKSLVFIFDYGVRPEAQLSGEVLGRLYLDESAHCLALAIWPLEEETPNLTIPLLEDVEELSFAFYQPPDLTKLQVDPDKVGVARPQEGWNAETWSSDFKELPPLMTLTVWRHGRPLTWAFELPEAQKPIVYREEP